MYSFKPCYRRFDLRECLWPVLPLYVHKLGGGDAGMAGSFVECGLILMGTDDKQRKQASSLPGEICLLLPACSGAIHGNVAPPPPLFAHFLPPSLPPQRSSWFDATPAV